jgi:predicted dinucleotide-binding enzyme
MKIAIVGAGDVGKALGDAWGRVGHEVLYGVRNPKSGSGHESIDKAVSFCDVVVLAVPWLAVPVVLDNRDLFRGKIVIDCTNPINAEFSGLSIGHNDSGGETVGRLIPDSKVVKAFNTCGYNVMQNPLFPDGTASMFIASDDSSAKDVVASLANCIGFKTVDVGPLIQSRYLEALAWLWISMAVKYGAGRDIAFQLMRR